MPPYKRILASLALLLVLLLSLSCNPNPQPEALTPIPTLAPAATLTLVTELEGPAEGSGEAASSPELDEPAEGSGEAASSPAIEGGDPAKGATVFQNCAPCHGEDAQGGSIGPTLVSAEMKAKDDDYYRQTLINGIEGTAMTAWSGRLSAQDIEDVIAFLRSKQ
jgi:mono/diheme cytochrome c family protein